MPGVMANNDNGNVVAQRDPSPELQRQRGCWSKFWCLGSSRKRGMRIVPARAEGSGPASNWASNGASSSTAANQFVGLSPSLLAPPSSPASFANSGNPSTVQSPAAFTVSLCVPPVSSCSPAFDSTATMFTIGPYAHETTLVTPPAFSAFTTAPSTAPFTPPPELAHLTTPSSPDVPFAQLLTSLKNRSAVGTTGNAKSPYSASPFASPDYISRSNPDLQTSYHMYPESPLTSLISPASGISESGPPSPLPELEFPAAITAAAAKSRTVRMTSFSVTSEASQLFRRRGYDTPQSVDSNNHSRELEPIKILSPHRDFSEPLLSPKTDNPARYGDSILPASNNSAVGEQQQQQDDNRSLLLLQATMDSIHEPEEEEESTSQPRDGNTRCSSKTEEHHGAERGNECAGEDGCRSGSSSGRILLKVEVTCDDQVKVNMRARNGRYFHSQEQKQQQQQHEHHERSVNAKQWSCLEDMETMSVDCMELNLVNNTIKGDEADKIS